MNNLREDRERKMVNGVDKLIFADDLTIYIITRNQRVATRALKGVQNRFDALASEKDKPPLQLH